MTPFSSSSRTPVAHQLLIFPLLKFARSRGLGLLLPQPRRAPRVLYAPHRGLRVPLVRRLEHPLATSLVRAGLLHRVLALAPAAPHFLFRIH